MVSRRHITLVALAAVALLRHTAVSAGPVTIAPVRVDLEGETRTGVVEVHNPGLTPVSMQLEAVTWQQDAEGGDIYEPTSDILAFPPIFTIPPGGKQLVRVGQVGEPSLREQAYRLYFVELPPPRLVDDAPMALNMRLRIGIPVFSAPSVTPRPDLRLVGSEYDGDRLLVTFQNVGNVHVRASDFFATEMSEADRAPSVRYILPGAFAEYAVQLPPGLAVSTVQVVTNQLGATAYDLDTGLAVAPAEAELASR